MLEEFVELKKAEVDLYDSIDRIVHNSKFAVKRKDADESKKRIRSAVCIVVGERTYSNKLSEKDKIDFLNMAQSVFTEPNKKVQFSKMDNGMGIEEEFSGKKFYFQ